MTVTLKDTDRDVTKEFDSEEEAREKKQDLIQLGANESDLEIITNGAEVVEERVEAEQVEAEPVNQEPEKTDLPDRSLTDDPIAWLQRGSDEFVTDIKGTDVITKKGFRVLQHFYEISVGSDCVVGPEETEHEYARVKATAQMPDGRTAEAYGSAHTKRGDDSTLLMEMADTRAKSRVLSDITGCGAVAVEEMEGVASE